MMKSTITVGILATVLAIAAGSCGGPSSRPVKSQAASAPTFQPPRELALDLGNKVTMKLALIPAGKFMMGSPKDEKDRSDYEGPQHEVAITEPFYMGIYEVTQEQYKQVMGNNPSDHKRRRNPVERVSWDDAVEFCRKLSQKTGKTVRLPTEAEWEYACRAGSKTPFNTGETISRHQANCSSRFDGFLGALADLGRYTKGVGRFKPNNWGLYDMHGNVWEWCSDRFKTDYYANAEKADPQGPASGNLFRVVRGGNYGSNREGCRSACRRWVDPDFRLISLGFRVAVDLPASGR
ncbi:MAG: formylglycine-generating enzyme family protein [Planctomycetota bacterium]|jgi:formylglycine-generating enzyme required for sulfatase activity